MRTFYQLRHCDTDNVAVLIQHDDETMPPINERSTHVALKTLDAGHGDWLALERVNVNDGEGEDVKVVKRAKLWTGKRGLYWCREKQMSTKEYFRRRQKWLSGNA